MLSAIQNYVNEHLPQFSISGTVSAGIASTPQEYHADYLITHGFFDLAFSEWIQIISFIYVLCLLIMIFPKVVGKFLSMYKYVVNIYDELNKRP